MTWLLFATTQIALIGAIAAVGMIRRRRSEPGSARAFASGSPRWLDLVQEAELLRAANAVLLERLSNAEREAPQPVLPAPVTHDPAPQLERLSAENRDMRARLRALDEENQQLKRFLFLADATASGVLAPAREGAPLPWLGDASAGLDRAAAFR